MFSQGCFDRKNTFHLSPDVLDEEKCTKPFMHKVLEMLLEEKNSREKSGKSFLETPKSGIMLSG
ncbi:MAG: hypothetical protein AB9903_05185 [Vulcanimicrobiota bacterium]